MIDLEQKEKKRIRSFLDKQKTTGKPVAAVLDQTSSRIRYVIRLEDVTKRSSEKQQNKNERHDRKP